MRVGLGGEGQRTFLPLNCVKNKWYIQLSFHVYTYKIKIKYFCLIVLNCIVFIFPFYITLYTTFLILLSY